MSVKEITDYQLWDDFIGKSPQGTIFSTVRWMQLFDSPFSIHGYFKGDSLLGGIASFIEPQPLTPFQGILVAPLEAKYPVIMSRHNEVAEALMDVCTSKFCNHYTFPDVRPFKWAGWDVDVKYTYVVTDPAIEKLEKQTRYEITKAWRDTTVEIEGDWRVFDGLYATTFNRKGLERPVSSEFMGRFFSVIKPWLYVGRNDKDISAAVIMNDSKRSYYILGASLGHGTSSLTLWTAINNLKEIDLVGCNDKKISLFKRGFGGELKQYHEVRRV